jgi:hypothetical protein
LANFRMLARKGKEEKKGKEGHAPNLKKINMV